MGIDSTDEELSAAQAEVARWSYPDWRFEAEMMRIVTATLEYKALRLVGRWQCPHDPSVSEERSVRLCVWKPDNVQAEIRFLISLKLHDDLKLRLVRTPDGVDLDAPKPER